jgi:hypothetical protein
MAYAVESAFAKTEKHTSKLHIKNIHDLYYALTDRETFSRILEEAIYDDDNNRNNDYERKEYLKYNKDKIVDYFMNITYKVKLE